jgi:predicted transposase YbfD/YdcC
LLVPLDIDGIVITADALLTQRAFAEHLVEDRKAYYHFTVKGNQKPDSMTYSITFKTIMTQPMPQKPIIGMGE